MPKDTTRKEIEINEPEERRVQRALGTIKRYKVGLIGSRIEEVSAEVIVEATSEEDAERIVEECASTGNWNECCSYPEEWDTLDNSDEVTEIETSYVEEDTDPCAPPIYIEK